MIVKTRSALAEAVLAEIKRLHPYELPALLVLPTEGGSAEYCGWIAERDGKRRAQMSGEAFRPRHRPGNDEHPRHPVRPRGAALARARKCRSRRSIRRRARSSTIPRRSGGRCLQVGRAALRDVEPAERSRRSASPISARRRSSGSGRPGKPLANAIVWQDRRTAELCGELRARGVGRSCRASDRPRDRPLFLRDQARLAACRTCRASRRGRGQGEVCFGTVDSFLLFRLTGGRLHATDATNAARTMLYDIRIGGVGRKAARPARRAARDAAGGARHARRFRR